MFWKSLTVIKLQVMEAADELLCVAEEMKQQQDVNMARATETLVAIRKRVAIIDTLRKLLQEQVKNDIQGTLLLEADIEENVL